MKKEFQIPPFLHLSFENLVLKEELIKIKISFLQKEIETLDKEKSKILSQIQESLKLPEEYEINLSTGTVAFESDEEKKAGL